MTTGKHLLAAAGLWLLSLCGNAAAPVVEPIWLTILGDPLDPLSETVQVDVTSAVVFDTSRLVSIRANRSQDRMARDGQAFRSYVSSVMIDCETGVARHRSQMLYAGPLWTGSMRSVVYDEKDVRMLAFRDMAANPKDRIVKAACSINTVKKSK
ncbi:surface-adhesin E family protein [Variovorax sp. HJSM1_2]|uniref:surface-adhesin E family protein n=1 Tax=Variovorax sp. HJSM1_2 TaxID=3366263 RepID=UPI003BD3C139